ncbi:MAG TPA: tetratricopeptide repeat protein, partial [Saprospiraceae bacterium]|nr:tetratricopeptide repeat protein [Saprospiraceae bacterium]
SQGNYEKAMEYQKANLNLCEVIDDKNGMARAHRSIGLIYKALSNYNEALKSYLSSVKLFEESGNNFGVAIGYTDIGIIYKRKGNYPEALKYYLASLKIKEEIGDKSSLAVTYMNIGNLYSLQHDYASDLRYQLEALKILEATNNKNLIAGCYISVAEAHSGLRNDSEALNYYMNALNIAHETGNKEIVAAVSRSIGRLNANDCKYHEALKNYTTAFQIYQEKNDKYGLAGVCTSIGETYIHLNQTEEAKSYLMKGLALSKEIGILTGIRDAYKGLTQLDSMTGDFQKAFGYYSLYNEYKDSILNETSNKQIAQMKEQYESEKKDKEIQNLENEKVLSGLLLKTKQDSLNIAQSEKEKVQLENEKFFALNLFNEQQLELLGNEKQLQELQSEKDKSDLAFQKAESDKNKEQLTLLNQEKEFRKLELKKEKLTKNYFIGGLGLFLVLSFFIYRNYQTRQELKLLSLRNKIASDLHDDVGSTLSSISIFSQMAQAQSKEVIPALETIGESSRKMLDAMTDIVWTINPENDQFEKIIMRMRTFAYELLGAKQIEYEFMIDEGASIIKLPMQARKNLYLIFKEATNNMVKYADADKAMFSIKGNKDKLTMLIRDNGKGFDTTNGFSGNGLKNMQRRASEIGAQLWIDSIPGAGTTIKLELAA